VVFAGALVVALILAILADVVFHRGSPPSYSLNATADCLRAEGYTVSRQAHGFAVKQKGHADLDVFFARNAAAARRDATQSGDSFPPPTKRNVVLDQEGGDFPRFLDHCLRSR
jgi:hypothetical protein